MKPIEKIQIAGHAACCFVYSLLFSGFHWEGLYILVAIAYAAITLAECRR